MMTDEVNDTDFATMGAPNLVYVREVDSNDVLADTPSAADMGVEPNQILYAVHTADGDRIALLDDRSAAFAAARSHDLTPVSVH